MKCVVENLESRRLLHAEFATAINFAPLGSARAPGFLLDYGSVYGVRRGGLAYGWDADAGADAVDRNATRVQKNDTFIAMQGKTWNIGVENGTYSVYICAGDPSAVNDRMAITAEGEVAVSGITRSSRRYLEGTVTVNVTDGKLTIANASWAVANKIAYLAISSVETTPKNLAVNASITTATESTHSPAQFTLTRSGDSLSTPITVPISLSGSAANGVDYGAFGSSVRFGAGVSTITLLVRPVDDGVSEADETVTLTLGNVAGYTNAEPSATVTIRDATPVSHNTLTWTTAASRPVAASEILGAEVGGKLYTFGGFTDTTYKPSKALYIYDLANNHWSAGASLSVGLTHAGVAADSSAIYIAGGYPGNGSNGNQTFSTTSVLRYNVGSNTYSTLPSLPAARGAGALAKVGNVLYFVGGSNSSRQDVTTMYALDLTNLPAGWTSKAALPAPRNHAGVIGFNGSLYLVGGQTGQDAALTTHNNLYRYNVSTNTWTTLASMPGGRSHITDSTFIYNNKIYVLGGQSAYNTPISSNLVYDPASNAWTSIASLPAQRYSGAAGALSSTKLIYAAGIKDVFSSTVYIGTYT